jgi:hypothetical protein
LAVFTIVIMRTTYSRLERSTGGFRYVKTAETPFFHAGVLDLPPKAAKPPKNSRDSHVCFVVMSGKPTRSQRLCLERLMYVWPRLAAPDGENVVADKETRPSEIPSDCFPTDNRVDASPDI